MKWSHNWWFNSCLTSPVPVGERVPLQLLLKPHPLCNISQSYLGFVLLGSTKLNQKKKAEEMYCCIRARCVFDNKFSISALAVSRTVWEHWRHQYECSWQSRKTERSLLPALIHIVTNLLIIVIVICCCGYLWFILAHSVLFLLSVFPLSTWWVVSFQHLWIEAMCCMMIDSLTGLIRELA